MNQCKNNDMDNQPPKHPFTFIRDINIRGRKKDDSSSPPNGWATALVVAVSLFPKSKLTNPAAYTPLNMREEGRVREKQRGGSHGRRKSIDLSPKLAATTVAIHTPF